MIWPFHPSKSMAPWAPPLWAPQGSRARPRCSEAPCWAVGAASPATSVCIYIYNIYTDMCYMYTGICIWTYGIRYTYTAHMYMYIYICV